MSNSVNSDNKVFSVLAYISILWIVGLIAGKDDPKVKFHVNEGIILFIVEFVVLFILGILYNIFHRIFFLGGFISFVRVIAIIGSFVLMIIGIINVVNDREAHLPIIGGRFTIIK
ncbi:MAG: hypothetical protein LBI03_03890 [Clostridiales bacterium]|jgi:uncharacterized membrane protein|nr:hypothetical protein [Clostridiales bacterium]